MNLSSNVSMLLKRRGQTATISKATSGVYDPDTGSYTSTPDPKEIKAYFAQYSLGESAISHASRGERWVLVPVVDTSGDTLPKPSAGDTISGVNDSLVVGSVQTIYNGPQVVCYLCNSEE